MCILNGDFLEYYTKPEELPADIRIEELRHHLRIEAAVLEGARNAYQLLQKTHRAPDNKKALSEVCV